MLANSGLLFAKIISDLTRFNNHRLSLANILLREFLDPVHPCTCGVCYLFRIALCKITFDHTFTSFLLLVFLPECVIGTAANPLHGQDVNARFRRQFQGCDAAAQEFR